MVKNTAMQRRPDLAFQGKDEREDFQFCFQQHWIRLLWPMTKTFGMSALLIAAGYTTFMLVGVVDNSTRQFMLVLLLLLFLMSQLELIVRFYRYCLYVVVVTDKKIHRIKKTLLTVDDQQSIDLWMLQDINKVQHGFLQNVLGYGTLTLEAQETVFRVHFVPRITEKYRELIRLREHARVPMARPGPRETESRRKSEK
jgi:hypothetical protein